MDCVHIFDINPEGNGIFLAIDDTYKFTTEGKNTLSKSIMKTTQVVKDDPSSVDSEIKSEAQFNQHIGAVTQGSSIYRMETKF